MAMSNGIGSVLKETKKDRLGDFAKKKVAESDARMKKINPKGRKLDKNGNPIVTKEELQKSGMSLRDFLNKERGLTKRVTTSDRIKNDEARKRAAADKADTQDRVMNQETRKRVNAPETPFEAKRRMDSTKPGTMSREAFGTALRTPAQTATSGPIRKMASGGSVKGYGMARGAKACKIR